MIQLSTPVGEISRIGRTVVKQLNHLGIMKAQDLLFYFPSRYDDLSKITPISQANLGARVVVKGRIELIEGSRSRFRKKLLTHALISDGTGAIRAVWFNQPWIAKMYKPGDELYLVGEVKEESGSMYLSSPVYERASERPATHVARIVPVYPSTERLSQKQIRYVMQHALPLSRAVPDPLPEEIRTRYGLVALPAALTGIHFPVSEHVLEASRQRLKFDELLALQIFSASLKKELKKIPAPVIPFFEKETKQFVGALPFTLTDGQRKAAWEIIQDMGRGRPMNRLLEGDVGSGKTVVIAIAALNAVLVKIFPPPSSSPTRGEETIAISPPSVGGVRGGGERGQVAIMAPTEILARQHFGTFSKLLNPHGITVELRTSSEKKKGKVTSQVVVGTHALLQEGVVFENLVLAVVDEQHRFGVSQRQALRSKRNDGMMPHLLSLTATPIPRSLALVFYGDLDISILREMPKGRQKIETVLVVDAPPLTPPRQGGEAKQFPPLAEGRLGGVWSREQAHAFVRGQVAAGHQVFWTCPIIDPSDTLGVKAATEVFEYLKTEIFPDLRVGLLHGRMSARGGSGSAGKPKERERVMEEFVGISGGLASAPEARPPRIDILVATPVIEVGIDVPNATVMVIEGSERFGLAQLHQFRGRVGRGTAKSYCILMIKEREMKERLKVFMDCESGFELAEHDLRLRGPGEIYGTAQSGFPEFKIASFADVDIAKNAKEAAQTLLENDPELSGYPELKKAVMAREGKTHLE